MSLGVMRMAAITLFDQINKDKVINFCVEMANVQIVVIAAVIVCH